MVEQIKGLMTAMGEIEQKAPEPVVIDEPPQPPDDWRGWIEAKFPGWDPMHLILIAGLGLGLLIVVVVVLYRWKRESRYED